MDESPLYEALKRGDFATARSLIEQNGGIHEQDSDGKTPLHHAAFLGANEIVELLIEHGADVNSRDMQELTPLHQALHEYIQRKHLDAHLAVVKALIRAGADVQARTDDGKTPLVWAQQYLNYDGFVELLEDTTLDAWAWYEAASRWESLKQYDDALAAYHRARELGPEDPLRFNRLYYDSAIRMLVNLNRYEEALALMEESLTFGTSLYALDQKASLLRELGRNDEVLAVYQQCIELTPEDAQAWLEQGRLLNAMGRPAKALIALERASDLGVSDLYDGWYVPHSVVKYLMEVEQYEDALRFIDRAIQREPERVNSWPLKWQILRQLDRQAEADAVVQQVRMHEPENPGNWYLKGEALDAFGLHDEAMTAFERACALGDELPYNWLLPSTISHLCKHQYYAEALPYFERAVAHDPTDAYIRTWQGQILDELGRYEDALDAFQSALDLDADNDRTWNQRGLTLHHLDRPADALEAFERAHALNPREVWYAYNAAWALDTLKRSEEALPLLDRAIELDATHVQSWRRKGRILNQMGRYDGSLAAYQRAIDLAPDDAYSWNGLGLALNKLKRCEEAVTVFQRATELDSNEAWYPNNVASALEALGRYEEALRFTNRALQRNPGHIQSLRRRDRLMQRVKRDR